MKGGFVRRAWEFVVRDSGLAMLLRVITIFVTLAGLLPVFDKFFPNLVPTGKLGLVLYVLVGLVLTLGIELMLLQRDISRGAVATSGAPEKDFANSVVRYAQSLANATPPRDQVLLELRRWSSRLLYLNGSHKERAAIGHLALGAAAALDDAYTQGSILIDDLGWGQHVQGHSPEAKENIEEAIRILAGPLAPEINAAQILELKVKAKRHLASIDFARTIDIDSARESLKELRDLASALPDPNRRLHLAQLEHTEAAFILRYLTERLGPKGIVDPTGALAVLQTTGVALSAKSESAFESLGDIERAVKALKVRVGLLGHGGHQSRTHSAESRLARLQAIASRKLAD